MSRYVSTAGLGAVNWDQILAGAIAGSRAIDPDLPDVIGLVQEVITVERRPGGLLDPNTPSTFRIGDLRTPLRAYLFYRRHPWTLYAVPLGILASAFLLGRATR
jgi:hypothetical protein